MHVHLKGLYSRMQGELGLASALNDLDSTTHTDINNLRSPAQSGLPRNTLPRNTFGVPIRCPYLRGCANIAYSKPFIQLHSIAFHKEWQYPNIRANSWASHLWQPVLLMGLSIWHNDLLCDGVQNIELLHARQELISVNKTGWPHVRPQQPWVKASHYFYGQGEAG